MGVNTNNKDNLYLTPITFRNSGSKNSVTITFNGNSPIGNAVITFTTGDKADDIKERRPAYWWSNPRRPSAPMIPNPPDRQYLARW